MALLPALLERGGHVINISSIGVQTNPPRFSAYVASKAALDAWSNVVASEVVGNGVTFTNVHMPLVRTPMIAPTKMYDKFPTLSPAQAADLVVKAMVEKPHEINTLAGNAGAVAHTFAPKAAFRVLNLAYQVDEDVPGAVIGDVTRLRGSVRVEHTLARLGTNEMPPPSSLLNGQEWADDMPCVIILFALLERTMWKYDDANAYRVKLRGAVIGEGTVYPHLLMAMDSGLASGRLEGIAGREPAFGDL